MVFTSNSMILVPEEHRYLEITKWDQDNVSGNCKEYLFSVFTVFSRTYRWRMIESGMDDTRESWLDGSHHRELESKSPPSWIGGTPPSLNRWGSPLGCCVRGWLSGPLPQRTRGKIWKTILLKFKNDLVKTLIMFHIRYWTKLSNSKWVFGKPSKNKIKEV